MLGGYMAEVQRFDRDSWAFVAPLRVLEKLSGNRVVWWWPSGRQHLTTENATWHKGGRTVAMDTQTRSNRPRWVRGLQALGPGTAEV